MEVIKMIGKSLEFLDAIENLLDARTAILNLVEIGQEQDELLNFSSEIGKIIEKMIKISVDK